MRRVDACSKGERKGARRTEQAPSPNQTLRAAQRVGFVRTLETTLYAGPRTARKFEIVLDQFSKQARQEAERQLLQSRQVVDNDLLRFCRIARELRRFEVLWKHDS